MIKQKEKYPEILKSSPALILAFQCKQKQQVKIRKECDDCCYFGGVIKTTGTTGRASRRTAGGLRNRKPREGRGFIYVWAATNATPLTIY